MSRRLEPLHLPSSSPRWLVRDFGLALQLQGIFEVSLLRHGLMASSPGGPGDDERRLDPALR